MQIIETKNAPGAIGPYSQAIKTGNLVFTSGQIAIDPATGKVTRPECGIKPVTLTATLSYADGTTERKEFTVLDIDRDSRKISLGLRQKERNPWELLAEKYPVNSRITGKVRNMTNYGAFVEIENDIDGMIHVSDMSWTRKINNPNELLKVGDEVEARVIKVDTDERRIGLSIKAVTDNFSEAELKAAEAEYTAALKPGEDMVSLGEAFGSDALSGLKFE